ncbi:MAG: protoporphyrinogen oxidase [Bacteroidetes bacterium]|nr:protoporphyrinogen oxidase [Bacteroidota bacterium]
MKDVVIIGAGITGLATAHHLNKEAKDFLVLDKASKIGGVINSVNEKGYIYEEGPNSGVIGNIEVIRLFEDLKDDCELEIANENVKKRWILKNTNWEQLPGGLMDAVKTPLFSLKDKFRILGEPFRSRGNNPHETLAELVKRRLGKSFLDYAIDPFILGVYAGDPNRLVPKYALPKLYNLEQDYGSFIGGTVRKMFIKKTEDEKKVSRAVFSAKGGLSSLTNAIYKRIGKDKVVLNCKNIQIKPLNNNYLVSYTNDDGILVEIETKKVISTIGAYNISKIAPFISSELVSKIEGLHYTKVIEVILGFDNWKGIKLDAFGGLIPFKEKRDILGALFMSSLFSDRAPKDGVLFSIFLAGVRRPEIYTLTDDEIRNILKKEVCELMQITDYNPDLLKIIRHEWAIPQYEADSGERFKAIETIEKQYPGLIIGGNLRNGIGMADRILQAKILADEVLN